MVPSRIVAIALAALLVVVPAAGAHATGPSMPVGVSASMADSQFPLAPGSNFSTYLGNEERTSSVLSEQLINLTTAATLHVLWSYDAGGQAVQSQPVEQNGLVYFGGHSGYEYAVYATNGTLAWRTFLGQATNDSGCGSASSRVLGVTSTATVSGAVLYVDGGYPYLYALNSSTGAVDWQAPIGNGTNAQGFYDWSSPLIYHDNAYVGISSQCDEPLVQAGVDEISLTTHQIVGYFDSSVPAGNGSSIWGSPSVNPATNTLFVATGNQYGASPPTVYSESVLALNATTLAVQATWQVPSAQAEGDSDFGVTPTLFTPAGGYPMLTAANKNGILYAFYQSNLTLAWEHRICCASSQDEHISTAWGGGLVYAVGATTEIGGVTYGSSVLAFDPLTGSIVWEKGFSQSSYKGYAAPLWVNQVLIVPDQGTLLVLNAETGAVLYQDTVSDQFVAAASLSRGEVFAGSSNDHVYAYDLSLALIARDSRSAGAAPLPDTFHATASGGLPPYTYGWTFGDGGTSTLQDPSHTFVKAGTYHVKVVVSDLAGTVATKHLTVRVTHGSGEPFAPTGAAPMAFAPLTQARVASRPRNAKMVPAVPEV